MIVVRRSTVKRQGRRYEFSRNLQLRFLRLVTGEPLYDDLPERLVGFVDVFTCESRERCCITVSTSRPAAASIYPGIGAAAAGGG